MPRRKGPEAEQIAKKGLEARLELLIRNVEFKQDLVNGREMWSQYKKAPSSWYLPPDPKHPNYQKWMEQYHSGEKTQKRKEMKNEKKQLKDKYDHYLAKWDLNWGPWEYVDTKNVDFPSLSPKKLKTLFEEAFTERDQWNERYEGWGESSLPHMFRLPVIASDPVAAKRFWATMNIPADDNPADGVWHWLSEEKLDDLVHGQVGKKLTLELNLTFPRDVLEELVRLNLEQVFKRKKDSNERQRWDKIDFQLKVFDLHEKGVTFPLIRTQFNERPRLSTVKSAFLSIYRKINSIDTSPSTSSEPHDPAKCPQCNKAETFDQMCDQAKTFAKQDYKSAPSKTIQVEDLVSVEEEQERKKRGQN